MCTITTELKVSGIMKFLLMVIIWARSSAEMTTFTSIVTKGPCRDVDCSGGIWVDQGGPCWECVFYDGCEMFGCDDPQSFCFMYNASFPMNQYAVLGECRKNPCMDTPLLNGRRLTSVCSGTLECPTGYICAESVCCESLQKSTNALQTSTEAL